MEDTMPYTSSVPWTVTSMPDRMRGSMPPHLSKKEDEGKAKPFKDLAIDTGLSDEELEKKVKPGDRVSLKAYPAELLNGQVASVAMDDRAGIVALIRTAELQRGDGKQIHDRKIDSNESAKIQQVQHCV